jgi:MFS family permease
MITALVIAMLMIVSLSWVTDPVLLTILLAGEGIGFGIFLTSGQAFITENFAESDRGAAMGVYSMTGSIAATAGPFVLGAVADLWNLRAVFWITGAAVLLGILVFLYAGSRPSAGRSYEADGEISSLGSPATIQETAYPSAATRVEEKN